MAAGRIRTPPARAPPHAGSMLFASILGPLGDVTSLVLFLLAFAALFAVLKGLDRV